MQVGDHIQFVRIMFLNVPRSIWSYLLSNAHIIDFLNLCAKNVREFRMDAREFYRCAFHRIFPGGTKVLGIRT